MGAFIVTRIGLQLQREPEWEEWQAFFDGMQKLGDFRQWNIGDALTMVDTKYGETASQLTADYPEVEYDALRQYRWVAENIEYVFRNTNLSWTHHYQVAALEPSEQRKWLEKAERKGWSVRELRQAIKGGDDSSRAWLRVYNVWNFGFRDERYGIGHPGNIPAQILMNLNYYYTEPGDLVVDLFAGGGVTLDVCDSKDPDFGNRKCKAYDIEPVRRDIQKWDMVAQGLPDFGRAKMVFLDPPYWRQKQGEYSSHETNLANMSLERFHQELAAIVGWCRKRAKYTALIMGTTQENDKFVDHTGELIERLGTPQARIIVPYTTQQYGGAHVNRAKAGKYMLNLYRDLMIWQS